jgi:hypothetical protein
MFGHVLAQNQKLNKYKKPPQAAYFADRWGDAFYCSKRKEVVKFTLFNKDFVTEQSVDISYAVLHACHGGVFGFLRHGKVFERNAIFLKCSRKSTKPLEPDYSKSVPLRDKRFVHS